MLGSRAATESMFRYRSDFKQHRNEQTKLSRNLLAAQLLFWAWGEGDIATPESVTLAFRRRSDGSQLLSAAIRRRRQGIGAAALVCVRTARRLTGKTVGACATVLRRRTCHDYCGLFARARMPLMSHGSHRSMGIVEAKKQQADPDHLWGVSLVRHVLHGHPIPLRLILQRQVTPS